MKYDFGIIGAGIVGMSIAHELIQYNNRFRICILEKEETIAEHASGRNSGVLHAGFYYSPDSLKARLTRDGNALLRTFCEEENIFVRSCGKLVVTKDQSDLPGLNELYRRGQLNGVNIELISESDARQIEPLARTAQNALWSPTTGVADPKQVATALAQRLVRSGVEFRFASTVVGIAPQRISLPNDSIDVGHIINCAGLHADTVAGWLGFSDDYTMLPFIGLYAYAPRLKGTLRTHIYPVPNPENPFLGVHLTVTADGSVKVGPTAIPIFSREAYRPLRDLRPKEMGQIIRQYPRFITSPHHNVLKLAREEFPKYFRRVIVKDAARLVPSLQLKDFTMRGKPGIRAQLFNKNTRQLEMDFVVRGDKNSTHILNAVSPGWTSSMSFAKHVRQQMETFGVF